jgi:hypothetical protein
LLLNLSLPNVEIISFSNKLDSRAKLKTPGRAVKQNECSNANAQPVHASLASARDNCSHLEA